MADEDGGWEDVEDRSNSRTRGWEDEEDGRDRSRGWEERIRHPHRVQSEDIERPLYRTSLDIRVQNNTDVDMASETSEGMNDSVVSSVTDKYGFMHGDATDAGTRLDNHVIDTEILRRREAKWLAMLGGWDNYMMTNYKKVRDRCRKGIPASLRARAWLNLCGASFQMNHPDNQFTYRKLCLKRCEERWINDIEKDLHRNFPTHELFGGSYERIGQQELFNVLKAYCVLHPVEGYCQAQAPIAALLLMNMPAEEAFWSLVSICDKYIPGYYSEGMEAIQLDGDILFGLLKKVSPGVYRHLRKQGVEPILFMTEWFLCIFSRSLPWASVLRIWDMFFCEGVKVLFRVGLVLLKNCLPRKVRKKCPTMYETLAILKSLPKEICREEFLIPEVLKLSITEDDMEREHRKQLERRRRLQAT